MFITRSVQGQHRTGYMTLWRNSACYHLFHKRMLMWPPESFESVFNRVMIAERLTRAKALQLACELWDTDSELARIHYRQVMGER